MKKANVCGIEGCPPGAAAVRKIGLNKNEKRAIFSTLMSMIMIEEKARQESVDRLLRNRPL